MSNFNLSSPNFWSASHQRTKWQIWGFHSSFFLLPPLWGFSLSIKMPRTYEKRKSRPGKQTSEKQHIARNYKASLKRCVSSPDTSSIRCHFSNAVLLRVSKWQTAHLVKNVNRKLFSSSIACVAWKKWSFLLRHDFKNTHAVGEAEGWL